MEYKIKGDRLVITADEHDRAVLRLLHDENPDAFQSNEMMQDVFESLVANSDLQWITPDVCDDLTAAPVLAILGETEPNPEDLYGMLHVGHWNGENQYQPVLSRWAFLAYETVSPQQQLLKTGKCVWQGGKVREEQPA